MKIEPFMWLMISCSLMIIAFILLPLLEMVVQPTAAEMVETLHDPDVVRSIMFSVLTSSAAALISFVLGTPFAYLLARGTFPGKKIIESVVDLPIMIPHPVVGIALLSIAGQNHWIGQALQKMGMTFMGTATGIITVMTFVGIPFYINTVKTGFEAIPVRIENVARSLGASRSGAFFRVTFPLAWRSMVVGMIMCMARGISEFGAIVIVAYHPMVASVLIYERFTAYGIKYSQPVAVWLIIICLFLFLMLRLFSIQKKSAT
ncbi:MAG: ABC transporter permease [Desulfobacteraceae bacterium]|nr:ABC transporter permease [Desulfobacteraceae bacterium]